MSILQRLQRRYSKSINGGLKIAEYISKEAAVDAGYLSDWYIASVGDEPPVWTDAHIDELLNDFIVIPKDTKSIDVQPVHRGKWIIDKNYYTCSCCIHQYLKDKILSMTIYPSGGIPYYCPCCGTDMRGEDNG